MKVFLKYAFIFDPSGAWTTTHSFEDDLSSYFRAMGYETEIVKSSVDKLSSERIIYLERVEEIKKEDNPAPKPAQQVNKLREHQPSRQEQKFKQGSFDSRKGYLKK